MNKKEAIEVLKEFVAYGEHVNAFVYKGSTSIPIEALNMAIEALQQEPSEDCVSRKRLRESLKKELVIVNNNEMYWQGWHDCTVAVETIITDAPSVVPKGRVMKNEHA